MMNVLTIHRAWNDRSIREVVELIAELTEYGGEIISDTTWPGGQAARRLDTNNAQRDLGWQARSDLRAGLQQTIDWYRSQLGHRPKPR